MMGSKLHNMAWILQIFLLSTSVIGMPSEGIVPKSLFRNEGDKLTLQGDRNVDLMGTPIYDKLVEFYVEETRRPLKSLKVKDTEITYTIKKEKAGEWSDADFQIFPLSSEDVQQPLISKLLESQKRSFPEDDDFGSTDVSYERMKWTLDNVLDNLPRNHITNRNGWKNTMATFLLQNFLENGLLSVYQSFKPRIFKNSFEKDVYGQNVIGILRGEHWGTEQDNVVVVGAHWDTVKDSPGYNDNGSGVAALLEIARKMKVLECQPKFSVIFVTFDLEEYGLQGATAFVQDFLIPKILLKYHQTQFQGAYILDSILNFNQTSGSQKILPPYKRGIIADYTKEIEDGDFKGDFISAISRGPDDSKLVKLFGRHWDDVQSKDDKKLRFIPMILRDGEDGGPLNGGRFPEKEVTKKNSDFLRSDHASFWQANNFDFFASFKAIHITDTGVQRGVMAQCYHAACDDKALNQTTGYADPKFYRIVVQATLNTILDSSQASCAKSVKPVKIFTTDPEFYNSGEYTFYNKVYQQVLLGQDPFRPPVAAKNVIPAQAIPRHSNKQIFAEEIKDNDPKSVRLSERLLYKDSDPKSKIPKPELKDVDDGGEDDEKSGIGEMDDMMVEISDSQPMRPLLPPYPQQILSQYINQAPRYVYYPQYVYPGFQGLVQRMQGLYPTPCLKKWCLRYQPGFYQNPHFYYYF